MNEIENHTKKISESYKTYGPYLGLGFQLAATIILMLFLGKWLDEEFDTKPILFIICAFLGGFAGIYNLIKTVIKLNEKKKIDKIS